MSLLIRADVIPFIRGVLYPIREMTDHVTTIKENRKQSHAGDAWVKATSSDKIH